jgi:hypothetical protein
MAGGTRRPQDHFGERAKREGYPARSVYKLEEIDGEETFYKHYKFTRAQSGIAFATDEEVVDPRAPNDPHCHVPVHIEYRYDPANDVLELHRDTVKIDLKDGSCVVRSRNVEPARLARVDTSHGDTVEISAPAGGKIGKGNAKDFLDEPFGKKGKAPPKQKAVVPLDPKAAELKRLEELKKQKGAVKPTNAYTPPQADNLGDLSQQAPRNFEGQAQIAPQPQPSAPMPNAEPPVQEQQQVKAPLTKQKK